MESEFWRRNFKDYKIDYLYVIAGCLNEYFGGYSGQDEMVEGFFVNEQHVAELFQLACRQFLKSIGRADDTRLEVYETEHCEVYSKTIGEKLDEFFDGVENHVLAHRVRQTSAYEGWSDEQKLSYLLGIYARHFDNSVFRFANATEQVYRTHRLLRECSHEGNSLIMESYFNTPFVTVLKINSDHMVMRELEKRLKQLKETGTNTVKRQT